MIFKRFIGEARTAIDEKGRTPFPMGFRRQLSEEEREGLVVTRGPAGSLRLFVYEEFEKYMADLDSRPNPMQAERVRSQLAQTFVVLDKQNRILLPKNLLEIGQMTNEVFWVPSHGKTLALWNPTVYDAKYGIRSQEAQDEFDAAFYGIDLAGGSGEKL